MFLPVLFLQDTGLYEYKVFGVLEGCPPALLADVYMDLDYRKEWDPYVKGNTCYFQKVNQKVESIVIYPTQYKVVGLNSILCFIFNFTTEILSAGLNYACTIPRTGSLHSLSLLFGLLFSVSW